MRISEIKQCFDNKKIVLCIKDFWEEDLFRQVLENEINSPTSEKVYEIIRETFLQELKNENQTDEDRRQIRKHLKLIRRLSNLMHGNPIFWVIGSEYEQIYREREQRRQMNKVIYQNYNSLSYLYSKLNLGHVPKNHDIIFQIALHDLLYHAVLDQDASETPINSLDILYNCLEAVILDVTQTEDWKTNYFYIMKNISKLTYQDEYYWITKNRLSIDDIPH